MYYQYRRQIRLIIGIALLAGLVYGGLKGWMHYKVARAMDDLSVAAAGQADIAYGAIDTELNGTAWVRGITVQPQGAPVPVHIEAARLSGPNLKYFLFGQSKDDAPPPHLRVDIVGAEIALDPALIAALEQDLPSGSAGGCAPGAGSDPAMLRELGLKRLAMDASLAYDYDANDRRLKARMDMEVHQIERISAAIDLADVAPEALAGGGNVGSLPTLAGMTVDVRVEPDFGRRYLAACAAKQGQDVDSYRDALVSQTVARLSQAGLQLGAGLRQAVATYHKDWGDLHIALQPPKPLNPMMLLFGQVSDWQPVLGARVSINRVPVPDLSFELRPANSDELATMLGETPPPRPTKAPPRYHYVYRDAPVASLSRHVGAQVRLHLTGDQPVRDGILVGVQGGEARVEQRLYGGKITAHVSLGEIRRVEVREVEQVPSR